MIIHSKHAKCEPIKFQSVLVVTACLIVPSLRQESAMIHAKLKTVVIIVKGWQLDQKVTALFVL